VLDWQAKMDCFAALAMTDLDFCRASLEHLDLRITRFGQEDDLVMTQAPGIAVNAQKSIAYTHHAEKRMLERGISKTEVEQTIAAPLRKILAQHGREEFQGWIERAGKQQLLRVLVEGNLVILVVTVMATSKFAKYGVSP
jgi:hypothetical protein